MRNPDFQEMDRDYQGGSPYVYLPPKQDMWQRMSRVMEGLLYLLVLAAIMRLFWPEVEKQRSLNAELAKIEQIQADKEAHLTHLREEHGLLKSNQDYIEAVARDRLDLAFPGEHVVRIEREEDLAEEEEPLFAPSTADLPRVKPLKRP